MEPLQVIAAPRRLRILELVWNQELSAGEIAAQFEVSWPAVSQHLRVLKEAGLVTETAEGTRRIYRIDPRGIGAMRAWLDSHWTGALDAFQAYADAKEEEIK